jgi:predicted nucleic acid-binding protein
MHREPLISIELISGSLKLWDKLKAGEFEAVVSNIDMDEINKCKPPKKQKLLEMLAQIEYSYIEIDDKALEIASKFVELAILKEKSFDDCQHIAAAIISRCDIIVSWNFRHIVNLKTIAGVKAVTALEGYNDLLIYDPSVLIGGE